jgi:hypothetical protein
MKKKRVKYDLVDKKLAMQMAANIGCSGVHKDKDGNWMPCASHEELQKISNAAEPSKKSEKQDDSEKPKKRGRRVGRYRRIRGQEWEELGSRGPVSIDSLPGGGIVSGQVAGKAANIGPEYVRENDPDVFLDIESARMRARQIGCIGVSRRISKNGRAVWMPCTNMTDYANRAGSTALGRRNMRREQERSVRTILSRELRKNR